MANTTSEEYIFLTTEQGNEIGWNQSDSFSMEYMTVPLLVLSMVGLLANTLIIVVILCGSLRHSVFMTILLVLAVVDNLTLLTTLLLRSGVFGHIFGQALSLCRVLVFFSQSSQIMSSWMVVLISIERFMAVVYPLKVHIYLSIKRSCFLILFLYVLICVSSVYFLFSTFITLDYDFSFCLEFTPNKSSDVIFSTVNGLLYSFIPFCLISILNVMTLKQLRSKKAFRARFQVQRPASSQRDRSLVPMMLAVSLVFAVTTFPLTLLLISSLILELAGIEWNTNNDWTIMLAKELANLNHIVNFFLYCITGSVFRNALISLFKCKNNQRSFNSPQQVVTVSTNAL